MAEESTAEDVNSQFKDIVKDLFNIEVNTILRDKISAQKMPSVRNALLDIGIEYFEVLKETEIAYRRAKSGQDPGELNMDDTRRGLGFYTADEKKDKNIKDELMIVDPLVCEQLGGFQAFAIMRGWADKLLQDPKCADHLDKKRHLLSVLPRIRENADMLKGMFSAICRRDLKENKKFENRLEEIRAAGNLTPETVVQESSREIGKERTLSLTNQYTRSEIVSLSTPMWPVMKQSELVMVRKIWEVGTEVIAMQTTIQVDGDVITRLNPNYMDEKVYEKLSSYHKDGVNIALSYWGNLIAIARGLVDRLFRGIAN